MMSLESTRSFDGNKILFEAAHSEFVSHHSRQRKGPHRILSIRKKERNQTGRLSGKS